MQAFDCESHILYFVACSLETMTMTLLLPARNEWPLVASAPHGHVGFNQVG